MYKIFCIEKYEMYSHLTLIMDKKRILAALIDHYGKGKKVHFAQILGIPAQNVSAWYNRGTYDSELIYTKCPELSPHWLLTGEGSMFKSVNDNTQCITNTIQETTNCIHIKQEDYMNADNIEELPLVPSDLVKVPNLDIYEVVRNRNDIPMQPVVRQFPPGDLFHRITSHSMEPNICAGDKLVLDAYPKGDEHIIPGYPYVIDTRPNGFVTRLLYNHPDGYLARTYKPDIYPDFIIPIKDVIRIYRIVGLLRINVQ